MIELVSARHLLTVTVLNTLNDVSVDKSLPVLRIAIVLISHLLDIRWETRAMLLYRPRLRTDSDSVFLVNSVQPRGAVGCHLEPNLAGQKAYRRYPHICTASRC